MALLRLAGSVGAGAANKPADVLAVKARLIELGFDWVPEGPDAGPLTISTIRLFQSIKNGFQVVDRPQSDGRVDPGGLTLAWLNAVNAPRWLLMPEGSPEEGYVNFERGDANDNHDFGTSWLAETIAGAGAAYASDLLSGNPSAQLLTINDASQPRGGVTPDHATHQTGLCCDIVLPRTDGRIGGITFRSSTYHQAAARAMIQSLLAQPLALRVLFNDPVLIAENLCTEVDGHDNHIHFDIKPPVRQMPAPASRRRVVARRRSRR